MFNHVLNGEKEAAIIFCAIVCTELARLSPNTMISPSVRYPILLKILSVQNVIRTTNQKVGGSTPLGRATFPNKT